MSEISEGYTSANTIQLKAEEVADKLLNTKEYIDLMKVSK